MRFTGFIGPSYTSRSVNSDCQRCINLYPELNEQGTGKEGEVASLVSAPGLRLLVALGAGPIRGMWKASNGRLFVVSGSALYDVSSGWTGVSIGTLLTSTGQVSMADNGGNLVIVDGTYGYSFSLATDYYVIAVDANTIQLASTLANATAGTPITLANQGQSGSTFTLITFGTTVVTKTFLAGVNSSLIVQDLTYTADLRGTTGDSITVTYTSGATAGAEVVTVVGSAITVQISTGVSTATQVKAAVDASFAASALISVAITGTAGTAQVTASLATLSGGINSSVNGNDITITAHGLTTGTGGNLSGTGTLPSGLTVSTGGFARITDTDFPGANQVTFMDGYFIFNQPGSGQFFISGLNGVDFDALDIASSEGNPDNIVGLIANSRDLWVLNENTTEVFYNSGDTDFPFQRVQGAFIEHGCAARGSIQKLNGAIFWLGRDDRGNGSVYMAQGYTPQKVSTVPVDLAIQSYGDISDATSYAYQQDGHNFYVLNFLSANTTWVFDVSTNLWHERAYFNLGILERHRADNHAFAFNVHVVGDYSNGNIYKLDKSYFWDDKDGAKPLLRQRVAPHISSGLVRMFHNSLQLDVETGVGLTGDSTAQGADPVVVLQFSDDDGRTWSNEHTVSLGKLGTPKTRVIFRRLGSSRARVYRISITDPVNVILLGAELDVEKGAS